MKPNRSPAIRRHVGRRIAEERGNRGWTQEKFAERIDVTSRYIQSVEGGRENLTLDTLVKMANALRVRVDALLVGHPPGD